MKVKRFSKVCIGAVVGLFFCVGVGLADEQEVWAGYVGDYQVSARFIGTDILGFNIKIVDEAEMPGTASFSNDVWRVVLDSKIGISVYRNGERFWHGMLMALDRYGRAGVPGTVLEWQAKDDEHIYGLGERFNGLDQAGKRVDMWIEDSPGQHSGYQSYYVTPVVYSSLGYGFCVADNPEGVFSFNERGNGLNRYERTGQDFTFYLMAGSNLKELVDRRTAIQGPIRDIPEWAWGPWISRNSYETQAEAEEALKGMFDRKLPVAAIVQEAWKGSSEEGAFNLFNESHWPDLKGYFDYCRTHDVKNILWQVPIIHPDSPYYKEGQAKGYFVKAPDGSVRHRQAWLEGFANVDFTNPDAVAFWKDLLRPVVRLGVYGFKTDDGEDIQPSDVFSNGKRGWQMHNEYSALYGKAAQEVLDEEGVAGLLWSRSGSLGIEQIPALWAGDQWASWSQMASLIPAGLSTSLSGMPFWGHDIGGYLGNPSAELYIRWVQFGTFSPLMQYHGIARREPWYFGKQAEQAYELLVNLRMNMKPMLIELGEEAAKTGLPIMRPMIMEFPDDARFVSEDTQYMLGPDLLVAPVINEGDRGRLVKFPKGVWQHLPGGYAIQGPRECWVPINFVDVPVFVRQDAVLKLQVADLDSLGAWASDLPVKECSFGADRVQLLNVDIPLAADTVQREYTISFQQPEGDEGKFRAQWSFNGSSQVADVQINTSNGLSCVTIVPALKTRLDGRYTTVEIMNKATEKVLLKAVTYWRSSIRIANDSTPIVVGKQMQETFEIVNDSEHPQKLKLLFDVLGQATLSKAQQIIDIQPKGTVKIPLEIKMADTPFVEDVVLRCRVMGPHGEITRWQRVLSRPIPWQVVGPFPAETKKAFSTHFAPEWFRQLGTLFDTQEGIVRWALLPEKHVVENNGVNFIELYGQRDDAAAYALTRLISPNEKDVVLLFGSDDTLTVWLNGEEIFANEVYRLAKPDQERIPAALRKGENELMVKIGQDKNPWQFYCRIVGRDGKPITGLSNGLAKQLQAITEKPIPSRVPSMVWRVTEPIQVLPKAENGWVLPQDEKVLSGLSAAVEWKDVPQHAVKDNHIDLTACLGQLSNAVAYASTEIELDAPMKTRFSVGSDDGIMIWVNGERVLEANKPRGFKRGSDLFEVDLKQGINEVVCRISQLKGGWSFQVNIDDMSVKPARPITYRDILPY